MNLISDTIQFVSALIFLIHHQASIIMTENICIISLLLFCSVFSLQPITLLQTSLPPGSKKQLEVPAIFQGYQKLQLTPFYNQNTNKSTYPCIIKLEVRPFFQNYGQLNFQLRSHPENDFWQGGNLWDSIQVANRLVCVFESGEVTEFSTKAFQTAYKPIERLGNNMPFAGNPITYGKLVHHQQNGDHILYVSQSGCYLINPNGSWSQFAGFSNNLSLQQAKIYNQKLFVAAGNVIQIYSVDVASLSLRKQSEKGLFFTQMGKQFDLAIYKFEYDIESNKMYVIDREEGVKYFNLGANQSKVKVSHLLPSEKCEDMQISEGLLFLSCSYFTIANASTSKLIYKQQYPFHVKRIIINKMVLAVFGETSFAVFWITSSGADSAKTRLLYKAELPLGKYQSFLYLSGTKMLILMTKNGLSYGKIIADRHVIECSYLKALEGLPTSDPQVFGSNSANLTIYGLCGKEEGIRQECSETVRINVTIPDIKSYKVIALLVVVVVALILSLLAILKVVQMKNRRNALKYSELVEETVSTVQVNQKDEKAVAEMMKPQS